MDLAELLRLATKSRNALVAENLFLRKQLALFQERNIQPHRAQDSARWLMARLSRMFDWRGALVVVKPDTRRWPHEARIEFLRTTGDRSCQKDAEKRIWSVGQGSKGGHTEGQDCGVSRQPKSYVRSGGIGAPHGIRIESLVLAVPWECWRALLSQHSLPVTLARNRLSAGRCAGDDAGAESTPSCRDRDRAEALWAFLCGRVRRSLTAPHSCHQRIHWENHKEVNGGCD